MLKRFDVDKRELQRFGIKVKTPLVGDYTYNIPIIQRSLLDPQEEFRRTLTVKTPVKGVTDKYNDPEPWIRLSIIGGRDLPVFAGKATRELVYRCFIPCGESSARYSVLPGTFYQQELVFLDQPLAGHSMPTDLLLVRFENTRMEASFRNDVPNFWQAEVDCKTSIKVAILRDVPVECLQRVQMEIRAASERVTFKSNPSPDIIEGYRKQSKIVKNSDAIAAIQKELQEIKSFGERLHSLGSEVNFEVEILPDRYLINGDWYFYSVGDAPHLRQVNEILKEVDFFRMCPAAKRQTLGQVYTCSRYLYPYVDEKSDLSRYQDRLSKMILRYMPEDGEDNAAAI